LNNLALASWWHKTPMTSEEEELNKVFPYYYFLEKAFIFGFSRVPKQIINQVKWILIF